MTAQEYLLQPKMLKKQIEYKQRLIESYREMASSISSPSFEERYSGTRNTEPPFVRYTEKIDTLKSEIAEDIVRLDKLKLEINEALECINNPIERMIMNYRYVLFYSERQTADKMNYSVRTIRAKHSKALADFAKSFPIISP